MKRLLWSFVFGLVFCSTKALPVPIPGTVISEDPPGASICDDLLRLIRNTEFAIREQRVIVIAAQLALDPAARALEEAAKNLERAIATGSQTEIDACLDAYIRAYNAEKPLRESLEDAEAKLRQYEALLIEHQEKYRENNC